MILEKGSPIKLHIEFSKRSWYWQASQYFKENDNTSKFVKHVSTETSVIFS